MPFYCFVEGCKTSTNRNPDLGFYAFPQTKDSGRLNKWIRAIEKGTGKPVDRSKIRLHSRICSKHFKKNDFTVAKREDGSIYFSRNKNSTPSIFNKGKEVEIPLAIAQDNATNCRMCFKEKGLYPLSTHLPSSTVTINEAVNSTFNIDFNKQHHFPQNICSRCFKVLIASYVLRKEILKTDVLLREAQKEAFFESSPGTNIFHSKIPKLTPTTVTTNRPTLEEEHSQSTDENIYFSITEFPDNVESIEEKSKNEESEGNAEDIEMEIKAEEVIEPPKLIKVSTNICKKCNFIADHHLSLLHHIDISTENCIELYEPGKMCSICNTKFMLEATKNNHILDKHGTNYDTKISINGVFS